MKAVLGIISGVLAGIIMICAIIAALTFWGPLDLARESAGVKKGMAGPAETPQLPSTVVIIPSFSASPSLPDPSPSALDTAISPIQTPPVPQASPPFQTDTAVDFSLDITRVSGSDYSRRVSSILTNTGDADAHDTTVKVEAYYQGSKIKLAGDEYVLHNLGTIGAGLAATITTDLKFSIPDGNKVMKNGADFVVTISSKEIVKTFDYSYKP
ncbi:MAG: hypothetical protein JXA46_13055 [Dehalococcoidales bacterium]|nr:hypothetical protein [Dehalococcoidales bacterium]